MASTTATGDLTSQYESIARSEDYFRPVASKVYTPGTILQLVATDLQSYPDLKTVQPVPHTGGSANGLLGVVSGQWPGFNGSDPPVNYTAPSNVTVGAPGGAGLRGTLDITAVTFGPAGCLIDAASGGTLTNQVAIVRSTNTDGYGQGQAAPVGGQTVVGLLILPSTGIGSSIASAALVQASATDTLSGTPAAGDVLSVTIQQPYVDSAPGTAQTFAYTMPALTSAQAATVTTAATALAAFLNAQNSFSKYFTATSSAGVVTVTVNAKSNPWHVNYSQNGALNGYFNPGLSGVIANSLTFAAATVTGATVSTASGANFASGAGYLGLLPIRVISGYSS